MRWFASCTRVQDCTARDALRYHAVVYVVVRGQYLPCTRVQVRPLGTLCDTMRWVCRLLVGKIGLGCRPSGRCGDTVVCGLATACTWVQVGSARDALRYHAVLYVVDVGCIGLSCRRSGRFGDTFRLRCAPGVRLGTLRGEVPHLFAGRIRCSAVDVRTIVGLNRLGEVWVQTGGTCFISRT